jgi:hypothetical protein
MIWIRIQEPIECGSNANPDSDPKHWDKIPVSLLIGKNYKIKINTRT